MLRSKKPALLALACALSLTPTLSGCATLMTVFAATERPDASAVACGALAPITWSRGDTDDTIRQIREHNAAWTALCGAPARR